MICIIKFYVVLGLLLVFQVDLDRSSGLARGLLGFKGILVMCI